MTNTDDKKFKFFFAWYDMWIGLYISVRFSVLSYALNMG